MRALQNVAPVRSRRGPGRVTPALLLTNNAVVLLVFLAAGVLLYAPVLTSFFLADDFVYLYQIVHLNWPDVLLLQPGVFRPLHVVTWLVDYHLWGLNSVGYHVTNIVSHSLTSVLVVVVARRLFCQAIPQRDASWAAVLAGLVFLVHPSHTEAVSWIIGRHDILATLFVLCSWYSYMQFRTQSKAAYLVWSLGAFLIAMLFKESAITFPLILAAYEVLLFHTQKRAATVLRTTVALGLYGVVVIVYLLTRRMASGEFVSAFESPFLRPNAAIFGNLSATLFRSFLPYVPLQLLPEVPKLGLTNLAVALAGLIAAAAALVWVYTTWKGRTQVQLLATFLMIAVVLASIPTIAFGRPSIIDSESERYAYLPSVFASMLVGLAATVLVRRQSIRAGVAVAVLLVLGVFLELSNQNWRTAGELTASIVSSVAVQDKSGELAVVVPDDLNGAFIYRNGLREALMLFESEPDPQVEVIGWGFLKRPNEVIALNELSDMNYRVSLPSARGTLLAAMLPRASGVITTPVDLYRFEVTLERPIRLAYYSGGELLVADPGQR
jgi:hypothetical protein